MFKRKVFPPSFLKNMHYQGKGCYGNERVKAVSLLMDLEPRGTRMKEILHMLKPLQWRPIINGQPQRMNKATMILIINLG